MGLNKHMNRQSPCVISPSIESNKINNRFKCESCNRCFTTNQSLKIHISSRCPVIKNKKNEEDANIRVYTEIAELKETVNQLKSQLKTQLTPQVSKQTTINGNQNNTIINNYNVNNIMIPYGQDRVKECTILNSFLKENTAAQQYSKLAQNERYDNKNEKSNELLSSVLIEITENRYLDPENRNIYLCKKDKVMTYEPNETWRMKPLEIALREIINDIIKTCKEMKRRVNYPEWVPIGYRVSIDESILSIPMMYENNSLHILKIAKLGLSTILESNKAENNKLSDL
jgi:hypothetical protein